MFIEKYLLILCPSLRQKTTKSMTKSYFFQVMPAFIRCSYWCAIFVYFILGNSAIMLTHSGFLHIY